MSAVRIPSRSTTIVVILALVAAVWASGGSVSGAQTGDGPESGAAALNDYGPTSRAPSGGVLPGRKSGSNRWKYRGTMGTIDPNEQVVAPVTDPPVDDPDVAPLTGLPAGSLNRRAIVIKIDNVRAARPQFNINSADIVYEELVEAGATRLAAVYHSERETTVGPVRSARTTDIGIAASFNRPVFAFSGANSIVERLVRRAPLVDRGAESRGDLYRRLGGRPAPHNLLTSTTALENAAADRAGPPPHFAYRAEGEEIAADVPTASTIRLRYLQGAGVPVRYEWDPQVGGWRRYQGGTRHIDAAGVQVAPENVVVQIVPYEDAGMTDKFGEDLYEAEMIGTGEALIFTDGHVLEATWTKPTLRSVTTYTDADGNNIPLTPGRTWVALVPPGGVTFDSYTCRGQVATVAGGPGNDTLRGTDEADVIAGGPGNDLIHAGAGDDLVCGGKDNDRVFGDAGADLLVGQSGNDDLRGGEGDDRLHGGKSNDQLHGGPGADQFRGKGGSDQLFGNPDDDRFFAADDDVIVRGP